MQVVFDKKELEYIFEYGKEKGKPKYPSEVVKAFVRKVYILKAVENTQQLRSFKGLRFEALKGDYEGFHSIRVNNQFRIVLQILEEREGRHIIEVIEINDLTDYH